MSGEQLERRYRGLLRILPKPYREARGEELLSVLMDGAAEGRRWPETREVFSLAWLGIRVRARGGAGAASDGRALERTRLGEMARLVAVLGSALMAFVGVTQMAFLMRNLRGWPDHQPMPSYRPWQILNPFAAHDDGLAILSPHYLILRFEAAACWVIVVALLALGWWRAARVLAAVVFSVCVYLAEDLQVAMFQEIVLAGVVTAALFAARSPAARPVRAPGLAVVATLIGVMGFAYRGDQGAAEPLARVLIVLQGHGYTDSGHAMAAVAVVVAAACVVAYRSVVWPVALAVVGVAAVVPAVADGTLTPQVSQPDLVPLLSLGGALVVVAGLAVLRDRRSQRLAAAAEARGELPAR